MTTIEAEKRSVLVEREFAYSSDRLWQALTQPHLVAEWLMRGDIAPEVGHRFSLTGDWGGTIACEVLEVDPGRMLSYRWDFPNDNPAFELKSIVTFTLTPIASGTHLRVEQEGFRADQIQALGGAKAGWTQFLEKLDALLGRQGGSA